MRQFWVPEGRDTVEYYKEIIDKTEGVCGLMLEVGGATEEEAVANALEIKEYAAKKGRVFGA